MESHFPRRVRAGSSALIASAVIALGASVLDATEALADHLCGATITGSTTLDHDHTCAGHGVTIGASNVTLDLAGHTLAGPTGTPGDAEIGVIVGFPIEVEGVTVRNGTITGFGLGVLAWGDGLRIEELTVSHSDQGYGMDFRGDEGVITRSRFVDSGTGIEFHGDDNLVANNSFSHNESFGIFLSDGSIGNTIVDNVLFGNIDGGMNAQPTFSGVISGNVAIGNGIDGITVEGPVTGLRLPLTLAGNITNKNAAFGIRAVPGIIDGGGNKAAANGYPLQCLNVSCR
jgi:parallel beta-helix repeat protein